MRIIPDGWHMASDLAQMDVVIWRGDFPVVFHTKGRGSIAHAIRLAKEWDSKLSVLSD
jgi:hypothetical protein